MEGGFSPPWAAPELFSEDECEAKPSKSSDIYAFGCVVVEVCLSIVVDRHHRFSSFDSQVYTRERPFPKEQGAFAIVQIPLKVGAGKLRLERPSPESCPGPPIPDRVGYMAEHCGAANPGARPACMRDVIDELQASMVVLW